MNNDTLYGIIFGAIAGFAISFLFYWLSGRDLRKQIWKLCRLNVVLLGELKRSGAIHLSDDSLTELVAAMNDRESPEK